MTQGLPLFPLGTVLFPGLVLPLHIFEDRYRALVRHLTALPEGATREFGVVAIRRGWEVQAASLPTDRPATSASLTLYDIGCTAELRQVTEHADGRFDVVTVGRRRFQITSVDRDSQPYLTADVRWLPEPDGAGAAAADLLAPRVLALFRRYLALLRPESGEVGEQLPDDPTVLSHVVAATAALTVDDRQRLLAAPDTATRLRGELRLLSREAALLRQVRAVPVPLADLAAPASPN
ncbi:MAG TPA: LON peptidase substrate-binding domain-containing protein [Pilimelia sp.]|nr:LON peptidase substrate-binding domain-containing protein [Pilimelia sp.]